MEVLPEDPYLVKALPPALGIPTVLLLHHQSAPLFLSTQDRQVVLHLSIQDHQTLDLVFLLVEALHLVLQAQEIHMDHLLHRPSARLALSLSTQDHQVVLHLSTLDHPTLDLPLRVEALHLDLKTPMGHLHPHQSAPLVLFLSTLDHPVLYLPLFTVDKQALVLAHLLTHLALEAPLHPQILMELLSQVQSIQLRLLLLETPMEHLLQAPFHLLHHLDLL